MLQPQLAARGGQADLAAMEVARENEVVAGRRQPLRYVGEVEEKNAEVGVGIGQPLQSPQLPLFCRPATRNLDSAALDVDYHTRVLEKPCAQSGASLVHVVVSQHRVDAVTAPESPERVDQTRLAAPPREQVTGEGDEIDLFLLGQRDRALERPPVQRKRAQVEVRKVEDREAVQLWRKAIHARFHLPKLDPLRLEQTPRRADPSRRANWLQDSARSMHLYRWRGKPARSIDRAGLLRGFDLLQHWRHRDDVALELQFRFLESRSDSDQLGEMEDWHLVALARGCLELLLPGVEREVAERAGRHHHVGPGLDRLLDRLDQLAERNLFAGLNDREAAALDLRGVIDWLPSASLDDGLERPGTVRILEPEEL